MGLNFARWSPFSSYKEWSRNSVCCAECIEELEAKTKVKDYKKHVPVI